MHKLGHLKRSHIPSRHATMSEARPCMYMYEVRWQFRLTRNHQLHQASGAGAKTVRYVRHGVPVTAATTVYQQTSEEAYAIPVVVSACTPYSLHNVARRVSRCCVYSLTRCCHLYSLLTFIQCSPLFTNPMLPRMCAN